MHFYAFLCPFSCLFTPFSFIFQLTLYFLGRVLIIEGIEKAERNVLPVLNNLLENREMNLEDGRFLVHPARYDALVRDNPKEMLDQWKLVRVSERFRVMALGLPVPRYIGNPLDPPLRSRYDKI